MCLRTRQAASCSHCAAIGLGVAGDGMARHNFGIQPTAFGRG
jgi:hypothetical protein